MPKPDAPRFLDLLPPEMGDTAKLPLAYRLIAQAGTDEAPVPQRVAESEADRALVYTCLPFYKPISRCVGGRE